MVKRVTRRLSHLAATLLFSLAEVLGWPRVDPNWGKQDADD
jgi:hypothetical protein